MEHDEHLKPDRATPERRCILTQSSGARSSLIRLALGPDGQVAADLGGKLPGRGAWVSADRKLIQDAMAKGKLRGALARAFKTNVIAIPDDLTVMIERAVERRALDRLGLENRAGNLIWGEARVSEALGKGRVALLIHAADAQPDGAAKLEAKRRAACPSAHAMTLPAGRAALSQALGRENVVHAALTTRAAAERVEGAIAIWRAFAGTIDGTTEMAGAAVAAAGFEGH
jgi:predicted RNA-binding protein YlxR (DUF448 family)